MNIKTILLEDYVNYVDLPKKQNTYFKKIIGLFNIIESLFSLLVLLNYLNDQLFFFTTNIQNRQP